VELEVPRAADASTREAALLAMVWLTRRPKRQRLRERGGGIRRIHTQLRTSGTKFPTASLYFNDLCGIYLLLLDWQVSSDKFVSKMTEPMKEKFEKYWGVANKLLSVATILDPHYKLKSIQYFYGLLYGGLEAEIKVESVRKCLQDLYDEYASQVAETSYGSTSRPSEVDSGSTVSSLSLFATRVGLAKFIEDSNSSQHQRSELEVYLDDLSQPEVDSFDILAWWRCMVLNIQLYLE
jgi:hypothetical protein